MEGKLPVQGKEYFLTIRDPQRYVDECLEKIAQWREYCSSRGLIDLWMRKFTNYYGMSQDAYSSQRVISGGSEGELSNLKVNDLRALVQNQLVVVTSQRPAGVARAINSDSESLKNARIGTALAENYLTEAGFEGQFVNAAEMALVIDEAFLELLWDKDAGDPIRPDADPETGALIENAKPIMSGDAILRIHPPYNVAREASMNTKQQTWNIISMIFNRYDLAAQYPKFAEKILTAPQDIVPQSKLQERKSDDVVYAHLVIADRSPSVPEGRYSLIVGDTLLADMPLPYPQFPVERMTPSEVIDGPTGYCPSNDIMAMEQVTDALTSTAATNNIVFGGQTVVGPPLSGIEPAELAKGMRYIEIAPELVDKIKALNLVKTAPETFQLINILDQKKQSQLGSVAGTIQQQAVQGASGSAMALVQAQSVQFNSGTQRAYFRVMSRTMTKLIGVLRVYADTPRVAKIVGKSKARGLKQFKYTGKDLSSISSIVYEPVNPVSQTIGGRLQLAQDLIQNGMITSPRQYLTVVETGNLDALTAPDEDIDLLILEENEMLADGQNIQVVITENHEDHIKAHQSVLASPEAKENPQLIQTVLKHIQDHLDTWQQASMQNPNILLATGQKPLPPPPMMGPPPGPPGAPPPGPQGPQPPPHGAPGPNIKAPNQNLEAAQPNQPHMAHDPTTHQAPPIPGVNV